MGLMNGIILLSLIKFIDTHFIVLSEFFFHLTK